MYGKLYYVELYAMMFHCQVSLFLGKTGMLHHCYLTSQLFWQESPLFALIQILHSARHLAAVILRQIL